jgi:transaldolase
MPGGEGLERGLARREAQGEGTGEMSPVCTMMVGRLDDWLSVVAQRDGILTTPGAIAWSGVACFKKCYSIFKGRGYRARLLAAAYRHELHWTEFIGGDVILTMPYEWQKLFNASDIDVVERKGHAVDEATIDELYGKFAGFRKAYDEKGMPVEAFDTFGATARTLRAFIGSLHDLMDLVRDVMLPNPDLAAPT